VVFLKAYGATLLTAKRKQVHGGVVAQLAAPVTTAVR
jgi:hypothetical protein